MWVLPGDRPGLQHSWAGERDSPRGEGGGVALGAGDGRLEDSAENCRSEKEKDKQQEQLRQRPGDKRVWEMQELNEAGVLGGAEKRREGGLAR